MAEDFPAAHSMDTEWFAVDEDGHIAIFESGEDAAVPMFVTDQGEAMTLIDRLIHDMPELIWRHGEIADAHRYDAGSMLMFLDAARVQPAMLKALQISVESRRFPLEPSRELIALRLSGLTEDDFDLMHRSGVCAGCGPFDYLDSLDLGIFFYEARDYDNPPYSRMIAPQRPLRATDLPEAFKSAMAHRRLPRVKFQQAEKIQPAELVPCAFWGVGEPEATYLSSDGVTRVPLPAELPRFNGPSPAPLSPPPPPKQNRSTAPKRWWQFWK